tara:strand:+ start:13 stop:2109 length:2097 start_codon:yes stop_codon:yes gene_type:complete
MAVNKNFVVKNGLEVSTDLIFADASTDKVGIGSTIPATELDVKGGIAATDINVTGVGTIVTLKGTSGIVSTIVADNVQANNLIITGVATGISVDSATNFYVSGVTTTTTLDVIGTGNMPVGIITNAQGTNLNYSGIGTLATNVIFTKDASGIGATVGAAVGIVTYYGDGSNLLSSGVGIRTAGAVVGYGFTILNFIGAGNTFAVYGKTVDISIAGSSGGGGGGGSGNVSIGSEAPSSPTSGDLWYSTEYGRTFIWFDEDALGIGNTTVWVDAAPFNAGGKFLSRFGDEALGAIGYTGGTTSQASVYFTGDANTGLYRPSADHLGLVAGGTASLVVNPNGVTVTGILTGNGSGLTGVASTDNIVTATAATFTNNVNVSGIFTAANAYVTGILTAQSLNYNNVTDIFSTGIITATRGIQQTGNEGLNVSSGITTVGIFTATSARVGLGVTINNTGIDAGIAAGIVTAKEYHGSGANLTGVGGGSGEFNTSISGATQYDVTASMATAYTASATASIRTIVHSIHICNISGSEVTVSGEMQTNFSFAHTIPVPAGSAVELLKQPKVLGPSETIELQASSTSALEATIIVEEKSDTDFWDAQIALSSGATLTDLYTSTTNPSVVQSILLCNNEGTYDVKARVAWTDGSDNIQSYLVYDMVVPADSTVEICEKPKYLAAGYKLRAYANVADRLEITASGKQITS